MTGLFRHFEFQVVLASRFHYLFRRVKKLRQIVGVLLLVLWVPTTAHCALEIIPGLEIFNCETQSSPKPDCEADGCAQVENPTYKVSDSQVPLLPPLFVVIFELPPVEAAPQEEPFLTTAAPPDITSRWQISSRAALPPRAPSFVS
jgi:hypothetical protein